jgi:hypothetical protein
MNTARLLLAATAWADHGGPARPESASPLLVGLLSGLLALVAGVLIVVIVMRLTRRSDSARDSR